MEEHLLYDMETVFCFGGALMGLAVNHVKATKITFKMDY